MKPIVMDLKNIGYHYTRRNGFFSKNKFWALKDVSFTLFEGESLGIVGRNGAGKSTLLRILAGVVDPDKGIFHNYGYNSSLLSLQAGFVPYLTGRENTILCGLALGLEKQFILERMKVIMEFSGLEEFFDLPINSYSQGMKARLGFSIAFQLDPDVLLIDEVMGVGDEMFKHKSTLKMKEKIRSDKTVVLVTHDAKSIKELCDRTVWIDKGTTRMEGETGEVLKHYFQYLKKRNK